MSKQLAFMVIFFTTLVRWESSHKYRSVRASTNMGRMLGHRVYEAVPSSGHVLGHADKYVPESHETNYDLLDEAVSIMHTLPVPTEG